MTDRTEYMREYMRRRRDTVLTGDARTYVVGGDPDRAERRRANRAAIRAARTPAEHEAVNAKRRDARAAAPPAHRPTLTPAQRDAVNARRRDTRGPQPARTPAQREVKNAKRRNARAAAPPAYRHALTPAQREAVNARRRVLRDAAAHRDPWLARLRLLYGPFLRAQRNANAFRDDTLRLTGRDPVLPAHVAADLTDAEATLDAHIALDPERATEYFERHALHDTERTLYRLQRAQANTGTRTHAPRGRPRLTPAVTRATLADAEAAARTTREAAYAVQTAALEGPRLTTTEATRIQRAWERARARHERAGEALAKHDAQATNAVTSRTQAESDAAYNTALIADLSADIATRRAALPDPPLAPLYAPHMHPDTPALVAARRVRAAARAVPVPLTGQRYADLLARYATSTDPKTGETFLIRHATGRRIRAATVRTPGDERHVRVTDLIDAIRPCGLV